MVLPCLTENDTLSCYHDDNALCVCVCTNIAIDTSSSSDSVAVRADEHTS